MKRINRARFRWLVGMAALAVAPLGCGSSPSGCTVKDNGDGTSTVTCNGSSVLVDNAQSGLDGGVQGACTAEQTDAGVLLTCGGVTVPIPSGPSGHPGGDGGPGDAGASEGGPGTATMDNVESGANGCAAAVGNGSADDTKAIQCQIDYLDKTYAGGLLFFPKGNYKVTSTIHVKGAVTLVGAGQAISVITSANADLLVLDFDVGCKYAGIRDVWILGKHDSSTLAQSAVHVNYGAFVIFRDSSIWGGKFALDTSGVDGLYENLYLAGWGKDGGGVNSRGANWYVRDKIDQGTTPTTYGFHQGSYYPGTGVGENHFSQSDFSGSYSYSVVISDAGTNSAITVFNGCVFSSPIIINNARWTSFNNAEIGSSTFQLNDGSWLSIDGSYAFASTTVSGPGTHKKCSNNVNISCL